jgi:hypothetical protein
MRNIAVAFLAGTLCFALAVTPALSQLVQTKTATSGATATSVSATFDNPPVQGNLLIAIIATSAGITFNQPSGWSTAINEAGSPGQAIFYKVAGASESATVTVTTGSGTGYRGLQIFEYENIDPATPFLDATSNNGSGTSVTTSSVTVNEVPALVIVGVVINAATNFSSWTESFTEQNDFGPGSFRTFASADRIVNSTGSYSTGATAGASGAWRAQIVAFKGTGALPIQLASFSASVVHSNDVEVTWRTISETNNYGFEIERRRNRYPGVGGQYPNQVSAVENPEWKKIGFVNGQGTTLQAQSYSFIDRSVPFGMYHYRIRQIDLDGTSELFPEIEVTVGVIPDRIVLAQNYPNPFNPSTVIEFAVPEGGFVTLKVYNVLGQEVATLFAGKAEAGRIYAAPFNTSNLPSGVYVYVLKSAARSDSKRMILMK